MNKKDSKNQSCPPKFLDEINDKVSHTIPITRTSPKEHYIIKHNGEYMIFDSKEEMPEEVRKGFNEIEAVENVSSIYNVIIDGKRYRFTNFHDIPENIRKVIEEKRKN
ncbi:MAG TPA: hypothetical protein P5270_03980 [Victivallales bacterium]|nr:hypothetical protein [Victivallales bacterium]